MQHAAPLPRPSTIESAVAAFRVTLPPRAEWMARLRAALAGPAGPILAAWAGSRLLVVLAALVSETIVERNPLLTSGSGGPILTSLTSWDGWWYLGIERSGYHAALITDTYHDYAFFPLYPFLVRLFSVATPAIDGLVAVVLSNVLFLVSLRLLYELTRKVLDDDRALRSCLLLCIFPLSWVFSMAYGESLFLALSLGSLLAAERGRPGLACLLAALATLTRLPGLVLIVPLALIFWRRGTNRRSLAWLAVVPVGAGAFMAWVAWLTGSVGGYESAQGAWGRGGVVVGGAGPTLGSELDAVRLYFLVTLAAFIFLFVYLHPDRIPLPYATMPVLAIAMVFASGQLESVGRYAMTAFPFIWTLAGRRSRAFRLIWPAVSTLLMVAIAVTAFSGHVTP